MMEEEESVPAVLAASATLSRLARMNSPELFWTAPKFNWCCMAYTSSAYPNEFGVFCTADDRASLPAAPVPVGHVSVLPTPAALFQPGLTRDRKSLQT